MEQHEIDIQEFAQTFPLAEDLESDARMITSGKGVIDSIVVHCPVTID